MIKTCNQKFEQLHTSLNLFSFIGNAIYTSINLSMIKSKQLFENVLNKCFIVRWGLKLYISNRCSQMNMKRAGGDGDRWKRKKRRRRKWADFYSYLKKDLEMKEVLIDLTHEKWSHLWNSARNLTFNNAEIPVTWVNTRINMKYQFKLFTWMVIEIKSNPVPSCSTFTRNFLQRQIWVKVDLS